MVITIIKNKTILKFLSSLSLLIPAINYASDVNNYKLYSIFSLTETTDILPAKVLDVGLGNISIQHCGQVLKNHGTGIFYGPCPKLIDNTLFDVYFTKTSISCHITIDNYNATIEQINCDNETVTSYTIYNKKTSLPNHQNIVFLCQQINGQSNACPWVTEKSNS
ncbi:MAG: hypothetical protein EP298_12520 [Gammaproteobacteria bacterium]|nr:MAG: hypothetical protein EP298_12520 [Gammaproteobacteria bacterium]UTW41811.1 hypothetical protein KFE69_09890 [bacterium SCSIO 12844]